VTTLDRLPAALTALNSELLIMSDTAYFTAEDLQIAKKKREVATVLRLEQGLGIAQTVGDLWSVAGLDYHLGYVDNLSARSLTDVRRFVNDYLYNKPFVIGALASPKDAPEVSKTLAQYLLLVAEK
jgi:predicted Zn-dependent peptidase